MMKAAETRVSAEAAKKVTTKTKKIKKSELIFKVSKALPRTRAHKNPKVSERVVSDSDTWIEALVFAFAGRMMRIDAARWILSQHAPQRKLRAFAKKYCNGSDEPTYTQGHRYIHISR